MRKVDKIPRQQPRILLNHLRVVREHGRTAQDKITHLKDSIHLHVTYYSIFPNVISHVKCASTSCLWNPKVNTLLRSV